ncbi:MAG: outer membrane beta-barrel protein [Rhodanobacter sp.]
MSLLMLCAGSVSAQSASGADASAPAPMTTPAMSGPLAANPNPMSVDTGVLGTWYITGAVSGLALSQNHHVPGDRGTRTDLDNAQVFIQKTSGQLQFFLQAGSYSIPALGTEYLSANKSTSGFYGNLPQAFIKYVPNDHFNIMVGKLPTMIGSEYTFTFENMNIERGLLWNQENAVNRGVQATYAQGPITASVSVNDGYYSGHYSWVWGSLAYTIDKNNSLSFIAGGNTDQTTRNSLATPLPQDNSQIVNVNHTHLAGAWTIAPSLQYMHVPGNTDIGILHSASTAGVTLLANYAFNANFSLASRAEYLSSTGSAANGAPSLLYGPGSKAWSLTLTPTYQNKLLFVRAEISYVKASNTTPGFVFGQNLASTSQSRVMLETGLLF